MTNSILIALDVALSAANIAIYSRQPNFLSAFAAGVAFMEPHTPTDTTRLGFSNAGFRNK